jgi:hypothetical protein
MSDEYRLETEVLLNKKRRRRGRKRRRMWDGFSRGPLGELLRQQKVSPTAQNESDDERLPNLATCRDE